MNLSINWDTNTFEQSRKVVFSQQLMSLNRLARQFTIWVGPTVSQWVSYGPSGKQPLVTYSLGK